MVKSLISVAVSLVIVVLGGIFEQKFLCSSFDEISAIFYELDADLRDNSATKEQALKAQQKWINKKEYLHSFIPHNDIKEIDLWVAETVAYVSDGNYDEARKKTIVILELLEQTPKSYSLKIENLL